MAIKRLRYTVTLKVFNDDDPADNQPLSKLAEFDSYAKAHKYMCDELNAGAALRIEDGHTVNTIVREYGAHLFDDGIHLSYMISDKEKRYYDKQ